MVYCYAYGIMNKGHLEHRIQIVFNTSLFQQRGPSLHFVGLGPGPLEGGILRRFGRKWEF